MILPQILVGTVTVPGYQPPSIALDQPLGGEVVAGPLTISGWTLDNTAQVENTVTNVVLKRDSTAIATVQPNQNRQDICASYPGRLNCPNAGFTYSWDTSSVPPGQYTLSAVASDNDYGGGKQATAAVIIRVGRAVTIATSPAGLPITVDGATYTSPKVFAWVVGESHTVSAPNYIDGDSRYTFTQWVDGSTAQTRTIVTPSTAQQFTANFTTLYLPLNQYLVNTAITTGTPSYLARNSVVAENGFTIGGSASVTFKAGNYISLKPGFQATAGTAGTTFNASIDPLLQ